MILTAKQQWTIAMVYDKAAADTLNVPAPQREAFARIATRFRMIARLAAKIEATPLIMPAPSPKVVQASRMQDGWLSSKQHLPRAKYPTLAERLEKARAEKGSQKSDSVATGPYCLS